jgi:hypothetical protein
MEFLFTRTVCGTMVNTNKTKSVVTASTTGQTDASTKGIGQKVNSTELVFILLQLKTKLDSVSGNKANVNSGSMKSKRTPLTGDS